MVLLNSFQMELLKQDHEDNVADDDSSICGDDNGAAAAGDDENDQIVGKIKAPLDGIDVFEGRRYMLT